MELRHFDRDDWHAYAGCESADPLIAYFETFTLIVDGYYVGSDRLTPTGSYMSMWRFPDVGVAMLFALAVRGVEPSDIMDLKAGVYGGRPVG